MTKISEKVKRWRKRTKERMVKAFGNKCGLCGKEYPPELYEFHHLNPEEKEFGLGAVRGSIKSWKRIVNELKKCVMMCANCHRLVEYGYKMLPSNIPKFNEKYTTYTPIRKVSKIK